MGEAPSGSCAFRVARGETSSSPAGNKAGRDTRGHRRSRYSLGRKCEFGEGLPSKTPLQIARSLEPRFTDIDQPAAIVRPCAGAGGGKKSIDPAVASSLSSGHVGGYLGSAANPGDSNEAFPRDQA